MAYRYTLRLEEPGKRARIARVTETSDAKLKDACNTLLAKGTKVTIQNKRKI